MTAEREAMTLEDVRTELVALEHDCQVSALTLGKEGLRAMCIEAQKRLHKLLPAIANLSRAAEPVGRVCGVLMERPRRKAYGIEFFGESLPYGTKLYTHPPEPARDATRWRKVRRMGVFKPGNPSDCKFVFNDEADAVVDAAMAQESGDAT